MGSGCGDIIGNIQCGILHLWPLLFFPTHTVYRSFISLLALGSVHRWLLFTLRVDSFLGVAADDMVKLSVKALRSSTVALSSP